jgi:hypothetical protein
VGAQLIADHAGAGLVFFAGWINGGNAHEPRRKVDDFIGRAIDLRDDPVDV